MALEGWARCKVEGRFLEYMIKVSFVVIDDGGSSFDSEKPVPVELRLILGEGSNNFASSNGVGIFDKVGRSWKLGVGLEDISLSKE